MTIPDNDDLPSRLRALPFEPPSAALSARVLARAHAALTEAPQATRAGRVRARATAIATFAAVVSAVAVYLTWAVDFLARLGGSLD
jgi:hypothetical protein